MPLVPSLGLISVDHRVMVSLLGHGNQLGGGDLLYVDVR